MYAERAYFTTDACHHCATYDEHNRLRGIAKRNAALIRTMDRRTNRR